MQDVVSTYADVSDFGYKPDTSLEVGIERFVKWYRIINELLTNQKTWLKSSRTITKVVGLDNFATGHKHNLEHIKNSVSFDQWANFSFTEGDITDYKTCIEITKDVDIVLHQAALGSVPRSIDNPINSNVSGFLNMLTASKDLFMLQVHLYMVTQRNFQKWNR